MNSSKDNSMRIVIAPDSFKECASSSVVGRAIAKGVRYVVPDAEIDVVPMADGGEGTIEAILASGGQYVNKTVVGPLGQPVEARYVLLDDKETAVIEMAEAAGLHLVPVEQRDPKHTTTYGLGQLMADALDRGCNKLLIGLGGSATNDMVAGMAQALGIKLTDNTGNPLAHGGAELIRLDTIDLSSRHPRLAQCDVRAMCDVANPLVGPNGASYTYGPQKGATSEDAHILDDAIAHACAVLEEMSGESLQDLPGGGAAGGLGVALKAFAGASLESGVSVLADALGLADRIARADLVITGEGRFDGQSIHGKVPVGVAGIARESEVPVIVLAGAVESDCKCAYEQGITAVFSISPGPQSLSQAIGKVEDQLEETVKNVMRMLIKGCIIRSTENRL